MLKEDILENYKYLNRLAESKCGSRADAEDLVSETMLAAFAYLNRGGIIEHPRTWLANTFMHKFNSALRQKYRQPTVTYGEGMTYLASEEDFEEEFMRSQEAAELRRELLRLSKSYREVLIRYYFSGESVGEIAGALGLPEGTVKRRLFDGRVQIRKGLENMSINENRMPGRLKLSFAGRDGKDGRPMSLVDGDLIAQNILMIAYEKPLKISEISRQIDIPAPYIEPIIEKLTDGELMVQIGDDKYYTDFIIHNPERSQGIREKQVGFVKENFDVFWEPMSNVIESVRKLNCVKSFNPRQLKKLERWAVMRLLQDFRFKCQDSDFYKPDRRDGGKWCAMAWAYPADYKPSKTDGLYSFSGCRTSSDWSEDGKILFATSEFDTTLWDNPTRWWAIERNGGIESLRKLLWALYKGFPIEDSGTGILTLENIDSLIAETGTLAREDGKLIADIPIICGKTAQMLEDIVRSQVDKLYLKLGSLFEKFIANNLESIPSHLKSVPDYQRHPADNTTMAAVREAYERELHLHDVNFCCPPMVMIYYEENLE